MWRAGAGDNEQNLSRNAMSAVYPAQTTSLRIIALTSSMNISWGSCKSWLCLCNHLNSTILQFFSLKLYPWRWAERKSKEKRAAHHGRLSASCPLKQVFKLKQKREAIAGEPNRLSRNCFYIPLKIKDPDVSCAYNLALQKDSPKIQLNIQVDSGYPCIFH